MSLATASGHMLLPHPTQWHTRAHAQTGKHAVKYTSHKSLPLLRFIRGCVAEYQFANRSSSRLFVGTENCGNCSLIIPVEIWIKWNSCPCVLRGLYCLSVVIIDWRQMRAWKWIDKKVKFSRRFKWPDQFDGDAAVSRFSQRRENKKSNSVSGFLSHYLLTTGQPFSAELSEAYKQRRLHWIHD